MILAIVQEEQFQVQVSQEYQDLPMLGVKQLLTREVQPQRQEQQIHVQQQQEQVLLHPELRRLQLQLEQPGLLLQAEHQLQKLLQAGLILLVIQRLVQAAAERQLQLRVLILLQVAQAVPAGQVPLIADQALQVAVPTVDQVVAQAEVVVPTAAQVAQVAVVALTAEAALAEAAARTAAQVVAQVAEAVVHTVAQVAAQAEAVLLLLALAAAQAGVVEVQGVAHPGDRKVFLIQEGFPLLI